MLGNLSKFVAAIIGAIVSRQILKWTGLDVVALGVAGELHEVIYFMVETAVSVIGGAIAGAFVYFFPANKPKEQVPEFTGTEL